MKRALLLGFLITFTVVLTATPTTAAPECGDGICSLREDAAVCSADCAAFQATLSLQRFKIIRGTPITLPIHINHLDKNIQSPEFTASSNLSNYTTFPDSPKEVSDGVQVFDITFSVPQSTLKNKVDGHINVKAHGVTIQVPVIMDIITASQQVGSLNVDALREQVEKGKSINYAVEMKTRTELPENRTVSIALRSPDLQKDIQIDAFNLTSSSTSTVRRVTLDDDISTRLENASRSGDINHVYDLIGSFQIRNSTLRGVSVLTVYTPFYATQWFQITMIVLGASPIIGGAAYGIRRYLEYRRSQKRYVPPDSSKLPGADGDARLFGVGRIGGTDSQAYLDAEDFTTHALVAGSTGSGKSVTASVIVEEALENDIPVVAFDPTTQWTGFLAACKDENVLEAYDKFDISKDERKSYKGLIYTPEDAGFDVDFEKCLNPGEITVFNLAELSITDYDQVVSDIIDTLFEQGWEESPDLRLLVVFDEVHRLLDERCSGDGYQGLIRAAREFRKWGIGVIMSSQVSSDFKEEIGGNVLTEVQLNTKNMSDIEKVKSKYGNEYARRVTRQGVGVGLVQNPRYNDGNPWFLEFRPPYHDPHKLSDDDLEAYDKYTSELDELRAKIEEKKDAGEDMSDIELDLDLAEDKLKEGKFNMVDIYIGDLQERLDVNL